jgi:predicted enzyme related to lactoylglutathione lyase
MITGFGGTTIWSQDLNNLLPFYRDELGLKPSMESERFVIFGDTNAPTLALGSHSEVKGKNEDPARHMVGLTTDDVDGDYQRLSSKGVEFIEQPTNYDGIRIATLKDPEGNLVQLFQMSG